MGGSRFSNRQLAVCSGALRERAAQFKNIGSKSSIPASLSHHLVIGCNAPGSLFHSRAASDLTLEMARRAPALVVPNVRAGARLFGNLLAFLCGIAEYVALL
jgi:hypothetical protein